MKKIKNLSFLVFFISIFAVILNSCENNDSIQKEISLTFVQKNAEIPIGHFSEELNYNKADYLKLINVNKTHLRTSDNTCNISIDLIDSLTKIVLLNYPITYGDIDFERIKVDFPTLSDEQIVENIAQIDSFYNYFIQYDLAVEIGKSNSVSTLRSYYLGTSMNREEFWFVFFHARLAGGIKSATNNAVSYTNKYFPTGSQYQNVADAYRHSTWNALICKESGSICEWVSECQKIAKGFTDAHESGATKPDEMTDDEYKLDKGMDLHNNEVGRYYFSTVGYSYKKCWLCDRYVKSQSNDEIAAGVYKYVTSAVKVLTIEEMKSKTNLLVYLKD